MERRYYYKLVTNLGLAGVQADTTLGKWDGRLQLANSSPLNPRSVFEKDQMETGPGGLVTASARIPRGFSAYRGPYLDRQYPFFHLAKRRQISDPRTAGGVDVNGRAATGTCGANGSGSR